MNHITGSFRFALIFNVGCAKNDDPQPEEYDNLIVYGNIYTARVDESKGKDSSERYVMAEAMAVKDGKFVCVGTKAEADKYADFVILDKDVLSCDAHTLGDVQVLRTFFEGRYALSSK